MGGESPPEPHILASAGRDGCPSTGAQPWEDMAARGFSPAPGADMTHRAGLLLPLGLALALAPMQLRPADCRHPGGPAGHPGCKLLKAQQLKRKFATLPASGCQSSTWRRGVWAPSVLVSPPTRLASLTGHSEPWGPRRLGPHPKGSRLPSGGPATCRHHAGGGLFAVPGHSAQVLTPLGPYLQRYVGAWKPAFSTSRCRALGAGWALPPQGTGVP